MSEAGFTVAVTKLLSQLEKVELAEEGPTLRSIDPPMSNLIIAAIDVLRCREGTWVNPVFDGLLLRKFAYI